MNNNVEMSNSSQGSSNNSTRRKRNRNWNNNNQPSPKRTRLTKKKSVTFKNTPNRKNLNMSKEAQNYRKPIVINRKNTANMPNYYTNKRKSLEKGKRIREHKEKIRSLVGKLTPKKK
jgi:hypothetical protein